MLNYLKWVSIAGIWLPIMVLAAWVLASWTVGVINPGDGWGMVVIGYFLTFALSHALAVCSAIGIGLVVARQAASPVLTLVSAAVGGSISAFFFSHIYFGVGS